MSRIQLHAVLGMPGRVRCCLENARYTGYKRRACLVCLVCLECCLVCRICMLGIPGRFDIYFKGFPLFPTNLHMESS